jgi:hypothetical protein
MVFGAGVGTYVLSVLVGYIPGLVETVYARGIGPVLNRPLSLLTGVVPLSLAEWLVTGYVVWLLTAAVIAVRDVRHERRALRNALAVGGLRVARDAGVLLIAFYVLWGFNYSRATFETRVGWPEWSGADVEELAQYTTELIEAGNEAYLALHGVEDAGVPTRLPPDRGALYTDLGEGWRRTVELLDLPPTMASRYGNPKLPLSSPIAARLGITGFYFPFTGEANVRRGVPALTFPRSAAHEQAHQRGIGSESTANFLGYMVCALAPNPHARYSGIVYGQRRLATALAAADRDRWTALSELVLPGVKRDLRHQRDYFRQFEGVGTAVGGAVNDRYLRAHRVPGGLQNYGHAVRLLIAYARLNAGRALPAIDPVHSP